MPVPPLLILLFPDTPAGPTRDLAQGTRGCMAAALHVCGIDVFAPNDPAVDGRDDPRVAIGGVRGSALLKHPLRPPSGFVRLEIDEAGDALSGQVQLLAATDLAVQMHEDLSGGPVAFVESLESAVSRVAEAFGFELPVGWEQLLRTDDPTLAMQWLRSDGAAAGASASVAQPYLN